MNTNPPENTSESPFRLFVSYAHKGEARKDRLLTALAPYKRNGLIETWDDREIDAGDDWEAEINKAMEKAHAAIFILDEPFLASDFCLDKEVGYFLQRHRDEGALILFVFADYCGWKAFDFIRQFQIVPGDDKPIIAFRPHSKAYTDVAEKIEQKLRKHRNEQGLPKRAALATATAPAQPVTGSRDALLAKLPGATTHLFGREAELAQIDAWKDHQGVLLWVAEGGAGKSALMRKWLETQNWPAGTRFIGHSFYSQGSNNQATSARGFLLDALKQLDVGHEVNASDDELGRLLAKEAAGQLTVLALDGIEPLQQASTDEKLNGTLKDSGLAVLLEALAKRPGQALCLASSRLPVPECGISDGAYFRQRTLDLLPPAGARQLLESRDVTGTADELAKLAERCGYHPLALVLAAEFCHTYLQDSAAEFLKRDWQPQPKGHAATVMGWFDEVLKEEHQALDRELARILGLFDRPAPWGALVALKDADPIPGLSVALHEASETALLESLVRLSQWGLLDADLTRRQPDLDAHPLVREHFGKLLEEQDPAAWRAAHNVLFEWFCGVPEKEQPDTLEELEPLYRAVGHCCKAGQYRTALHNIYRERIQRDDQGFSMFQLGAYSADLAALAGFFPLGWSNPPVVSNSDQISEALSEDDRTGLLSELAFCLAILGQPEEALGIRHIGQQREKESEDWINYCLSSNNLVHLLSSLGRWIEAEAVSRKADSAVAHIEDKEDHWQCAMITFATAGRILHGQGRLIEALATYIQAETLQAQNDSEFLKLYSIYGYDYTQLLLEQAGQTADWHEVLGRGLYALEISEQYDNLPSQASDHCTIGLARAALGDADAGLALDLAVTTMRRAGSILFQPDMYLARAHYLRHLPNLPAARSDHDAALAIAQRGNMRTYLAECALLAGNLCLDEGRVPDAAAQYATSAQLIREDGYGRRLSELHLLYARLLHAQHDPAAPSVLAEAEARIREVGQWYFWRELRAVAKEIGAPDPGECPFP